MPDADPDLKPFDDIHPDFPLTRENVHSMDQINAYRTGTIPPPACKSCGGSTTLMPGHTAMAVSFTCAACDGPGMAELTPEQAEALRDAVPHPWNPTGAGMPMGSGVGARVPRYPGLEYPTGSVFGDDEYASAPLGCGVDLNHPFTPLPRPPGKIRRLLGLLTDFAIESCEDTAQTLRMVREMLVPKPLPPWDLTPTPWQPMMGDAEYWRERDLDLSETGGGIFKGGLGG